jgi:hypothetical protein
MKKFMLLILTFLMVPQFAMANQTDGLKQALDEFYYSMTVEWDQKDPEFSRAQEQLLADRLNAAVAAGLTREELASLFTQTTSLDLNEVMMEIQRLNLQSPDEIKALLISKMHARYFKGASWNGEAVGMVLIAALAAFIVIGLVYEVAKCSARDYGNSCW